MTQRSPKLDMPYLQPSQAQKHVTHNEAIQQLDAVTQLAVEQFGATEPPADPDEGACYAIGAGATGDWAGQDGALACRTGAGWLYLQPREGWRAWSMADDELWVWRSGTWARQVFPVLGVNTTADATNRLAVAGEAVLLTHTGGGHQLKINKASALDSASLLFQAGWTGHAEIGLAGNNDLALKVSPDGSGWTDALTIDAATGLASGNAVQSAPSDTTPGRLMRADYGYGPGNLVGQVSESGGVPAGAVIESGAVSGLEYTRWADGTQLCWGERTYGNVDVDTPSGGAFQSAPFNEGFPAAFVAPPSVLLHGRRVDGVHDGWAIAETVSATGFSGVHLALTSAVAQTRIASFAAFGRWFAP